MILEKIGLPLVGFTAHEPVEVLETHPARPLVIRSSQAVDISRSIMVLAKPRGGVTVLLQDLADGGAILCDNRIITWIACGLFRDHTKARGVVIAAGNQRRARGRTERSGVELRVTQSRFCNPVHGRRWDHAAESTIPSVALVVGHDQ